MTKRILSFLLCAVMLFGLTPYCIAPLAAEESAAEALFQAKASVETRAEVLPLPVKDADWDKALTIDKAENPAHYQSHGKEATVTYSFDKAAKKMTVNVTYNLNSWLGVAALTDKNGKEIMFETDRTYGNAKAGNTLWSFHYAENTSSPAAVKTFTFTVENVTKLPDKYVFYASNMGTQTFFTAKITIDF